MEEVAPRFVEFEDWYREEHPRLVASLLVVAAGDLELAREAAAEAFTRALERWSRVVVMDSPGAWTHRVALNVLRRRARRAAVEDVLLRRRRVEDAEMSPLLDPELWAAVRALPLRQRTAVALRYVDDLSYSEIASRMGIAVGTVAPTLAKAHQRLARSLGEEPVTVSGGTQ